MIGRTLKFIREEKCFSQKYVANAIFSPSQFSKIESDDQNLTAENLIKLLNRLCVTFDEFCLFTEDDHIKARVQSKHYVAELYANQSQLQEGIEKMDIYYEKFKDVYFYHISCLLKAMHTLLATNNDYEKARKELAPVADYLASTGNWFYYELSLFTNVLYLYPRKTAISEGKSALKKINEQYERFKDYDITRSLLINLAIYSLDEKQYMQSLEFSCKILAFPPSTNYLYDALLAKIVSQVAYYKLNSVEYDKQYLSSLINNFKFSRLDNIYKQALDFASKHGISLDEHSLKDSNL